MKQRLLILLVTIIAAGPAAAQLPTMRTGDAIPRDMREIYDRGLQYLVSKQSANGEWAGGGEQGPGVTGMCLMVLLASGEDPNFGLYASNARRAVKSIVSQQNASTGILGQSMYHHGFGMLGLAEAYGAVDDRDLWSGEAKHRSIGQALELAVRAAVTSQKKNSLGAWRYSPDSTDADTSVSGAVLVGLLAARNAGIEVPDESIDKAINYYVKMTSSAGQVGYSGGFGGFFSLISTLRPDWTRWVPVMITRSPGARPFWITPLSITAFLITRNPSISWPSSTGR